LQRPGINGLRSVQGAADPAAWLEQALHVDFSSSPDLMRVTLKGSSPEELVPLLDAVREAYLQEAANRNLSDTTAMLDWLNKVIAEEETKLAAARADVSKKAGEMGAPD